jgi:glycosyltransferase involved in cell wall biosynthesis
VVLSLNPGGTERLVVELSERLHDEMPTAVCCLDEEGAWAADLDARGIRVTALRRRPGFHPSLGGALARVAREHRATVIHAHHYSSFVYASLARLWRPDLRLVFTEHGRLSDAPPSRKRRLVNRVLAHAPHAVFTVSKDLKRHLVAEGFSAAQIGVIYNGIDLAGTQPASSRTSVRRSLGVSDDEFVIGTVARLDPVKDLGTLIRATAALPDALRPILLVVGDGPERASLEAEAARSGRAERVRFLGHREDARTLLAGCDVYVNSSISEGISLTILEAMAAGLPVVATRVGGTPEVLADGSGVLVAPRESLSIAGALSGLASDIARRRGLGDLARQRAHARFALDRMVREYAGAYGDRRVHPGTTAMSAAPAPAEAAGRDI